MDKIVEAYIGEYASGKSELAVNRSIELLGDGRQVTLVDLDMVEPVYTLRPLKPKLIKMGLNVVAWETHETMGLGEAGSTMHPGMRWALRNEGDIILDIGYGIKGSMCLNMLEGYEDNQYLKLLAVVNTKRTITGTIADIVEYLKSIGRVDGIIANTHLSDETTVSMIIEGYNIMKEVSEIIKTPIVAIGADEKFRNDFSEDKFDNIPIRYLKRYMPDSFW